MDLLRRWRVPLAVVAAAVGALSLASVDRCPEPVPGPPRVVERFHAFGAVAVGVGVVAVSPPLPVTRAGYPPPRPSVAELPVPPLARAAAVAVDGRSLTVVSLDALYVTDRMQRAVQEPDGGPVLLVATHTHASVGQFDPRPAAELAGLGPHRPVVEAALVEAVREAARQARANLAPGSISIAGGAMDGLTVPRSGARVDPRLTVVQLDDAAGRPVARWVIAAAHPTLVPRAEARIDPDWPGALSAREEAGGGPLTLVLPGAVGNATVDRAVAGTSAAFAERLAAAMGRLEPRRLEPPLALSFAAVEAPLPPPDGSRLVPWPFRALVRNVLCDGSPPSARVAVVGLGDTRVLFVPFEPSAETGGALERAGGAARVVGVALGYDGYLEPAEVVRAGEGEARRQYYGPELLEVVAQAVSVASAAAGR